jgi:predicted transcriptional regulator
MEAYIQHLTGQSEQQQQYGGLASYGETSGTNHLETKQSDEQKGNVNSSKLMMENRLRVLQPAEAEGFRRLAAQYLSQHTVSERQLDMIFVMGSEGYSERIQVAKHLNLSNSTLKEEFVHLAQEGLIEQEEISLDGKTFIHRLSPLGVGVYLAQQFDEKAPLVYSEMECIIQDHQNVHHGYFIKDTKYRLSEQGFLHVTDDRKSNTREVAGGKLYIADITGVNPVTNEMWYIECEHVTQSHKELTEKLLKAAQVTSRLYVVVPSKEEGERFEKFYLEYVTILLSHNRKPLPVMLATRRQFKKQEFQELQLEELSLRYPDEAAAYRKKHPPFKPKPGDDE